MAPLFFQETILHNITDLTLARMNYAILSSNSPPGYTRQFLRAVGLFALYFLRLKSSAGNGNPAELF
jgi:hypothetical protein